MSFFSSNEGVEAEDYLFSNLSIAFNPLKMHPVEVLEGPLWEALWPHLCVPDILQMHVAAKNWNDAGRFGPFCELFFFLMRHELGDGEAAVGSPVDLCEYMPTLNSRGTEPRDGRRRT